MHLTEFLPFFASLFFAVMFWLCDSIIKLGHEKGPSFTYVEVQLCSWIGLCMFLSRAYSPFLHIDALLFLYVVVFV